jgi:hypothetical protein
MGPAKITDIHNTPLPQTKPYISICIKIGDPSSYVEVKDYCTYCTADGYVNCSVFNYMSNKCENLSLKAAKKDRHKVPIINLDETKYIPICTKAKNMKDVYDFIFCDDDSYVNCPIYKHEVDSKP